MIEERREKSAIFCAQMVNFPGPSHIYQLVRALLFPQIYTMVHVSHTIYWLV